MPPIELIERPAFPQPVANEKIAIVHINGHRVGRVSLDFHGMGTGVLAASIVSFARSMDPL